MRVQYAAGSTIIFPYFFSGMLIFIEDNKLDHSMRQKKKILFTTFEGSEKDQLLESIERTPEERLVFLKRLQQINLDAPKKTYDIEDNRKRLSLKRKKRRHKHGQ